MSTDFEFPWEREAMRGEPMQEGLPLHDQMAYTTLRNIYTAYREKHLTREQAASEKRKLRWEFDKAKRAEEFGRKLIQHHVNQIMATAPAICAVRKNPQPENALRLCNILDGLERPVIKETRCDETEKGQA